MSHMGSALVAAIAALIGGVSLAGEILILQPATTGSRNEQAAQDINARARQQAGQAVPDNVYVLPGSGGMGLAPAPASPADQARQSARDYADPPPTGSAGDGTQIILRAAPLSDTERMRLKARSYSAEPTKPSNRNCGAAANEVGTIGEGAGAHKSENVFERGGSAINPNCR